MSEVPAFPLPCCRQARRRICVNRINICRIRAENGPQHLDIHTRRPFVERNADTRFIHRAQIVACGACTFVERRPRRQCGPLACRNKIRFRVEYRSARRPVARIDAQAMDLALQSCEGGRDRDETGVKARQDLASKTLCGADIARPLSRGEYAVRVFATRVAGLVDPPCQASTPTRRPGIARLWASDVAKKAACGPPKPSGTPARWALPTAMSAPHSPGRV